MFNEELTPEEKRLKLNVKIKQKKGEKQSETRKLNEITTGDSFTLQPVSKSAKKVEIANEENEMKDKEPFQCNEKNCQIICKNEYELNRHIKKKHLKEKNSTEKMSMLPIEQKIVNSE